MLKKEQKIKLVDEIGKDMALNKSVIFVDFRNVKTKPIEGLRDELKKTGSSMRVVRKTLLGRAIESLNLGEKLNVKTLEGQIAVIFGDVIGAAKACAAFAKKEKSFKFVGGIMEGHFLSPKEAAALATIPSRHELLGQLVWTLASPMQGLVVTLNGIPRSLVIALSEISKKK
ncbi:MAG: 50S ribosomal protein L10 [Candidatus Terrybacteria bacterium RIFCSPLOWO2_01_FULL_44_24]|uniref:Large ribosomal subunit protein uL10 n=1 Tax=Candidatus Terrybacteria bacterium RIFCSPHIGHO2_01_FULL_43_35 TaxID=1802361 RepID=A0A1G2PFX7_9BACT|nr:MAG: 50S ribosomal protein L10 [Candidatus Terrybacteria bacterium RIFCSPHIGHO2_01_FULL_43_35]OHA49308.1 MAG: 50S ribosomal protein L10 [Candidatus Terrybacteria bacterium RIFCSPHIGHO2_02_FULL_43_14]OHA52006.1 MAG: 50S ribosomal protein L10 [Candidatus Terrybacteria bacterium RIFCSPLOWO2_01_FULL_44_24]